MVVEAISALLTAAALLEFLAGTIPETVERGKKYRDCESQIREADVLLRGCLERLKIWRATWYESTSIQARNQFWGARGHQAVKAHIPSINDLADKVRSRLQGRYHRPMFAHRNDGDMVRRLLAEGADPVASLQHPKARDCIGRFIFALYEGDFLRDEIKRMTDLIENLERTASQHYNRRHAVTGAVPALDLASHKQLLDFSEAMQNAYRWCADADTRWALLMLPCRGIFDEATEMNLRRLNVPFLHCSPDFDVNPRARRLDVEYMCNVQNAEKIKLELEAAKMRPAQEHQVLTINQSLKSTLRQSQGVRGHRHRQYMRKQSEARRASVALSVATWKCLMWQIAWFNKLCSCNILRASSSPPGTESYSAIADIHTRPDGIDGCSLGGFERNPFLLLGIILAELALAQPISAELHHGRLRFTLDKELLAQKTRETQNSNAEFIGTDHCTLEELVKFIEYEVPGPYYRTVEHCLTRGDRYREDGDVPTSLSASDFQRLKEKVIAPLNELLAVNESHRKSAKWYEKIYEDLSFYLTSFIQTGSSTSIVF